MTYLGKNRFGHYCYFDKGISSFLGSENAPYYGKGNATYCDKKEFKPVENLLSDFIKNNIPK